MLYYGEKAFFSGPISEIFVKPCGLVCFWITVVKLLVLFALGLPLFSQQSCLPSFLWAKDKLRLKASPNLLFLVF